MSSSHRMVQAQAREDFREARKQAFINEVHGVLSGEPTDLISFKEVQDRLGVHTCALGRLETVPLAKIVGSEGRYQDFDREFLPKGRATESRWENLSVAFRQLENVPPVELYRVGDAYFVRDGNHRVSVARRHGAVYIDAYVIDCPSRVSLDAGLDIKQLMVEEEHLQFLERTQLDQILGIDVHLTATGAYDALERHIEAHRYYMGEERQEPVSFKEGAKSWYDNVYQPTVDVIRRSGILNRFPGRTEGDLYVWVLEHQFFLAERAGSRVPLETAAASFARHYGDRFYHRWWARISEVLARIGGSVLSWFRK